MQDAVCILGIQQTIAQFLAYNKEGIIRSLWRNYKHILSAVQLVCDLSLEYAVYDLPLWNAILLQLVNLEATAYLGHVLPLIQARPALWFLAKIDCFF